jgi:DNA invertase Pin-like site-specific DNA recombinase
MENNRVAIYIRVSTQMQVDKDSLPMQRKDLVAYSNLILNTNNYEIFEDAGYSGKNTDRPEFQRMLTALRAGTFTHLLVWKIDRISRNLLDFATLYKELKDLGIVFVSKNEQFDTSTAMGEAMLKIILVFAELERNMTSERVSATMISRANNGQWNGGRIPYGYDYDPVSGEFTPNAEADTVRFMHDWYEQEKSLVRLARNLNESGSRTRLGFEWSPTSIDIILHNVFYCGDYLYNVHKDASRQKIKAESEWVTIHDHHPAIISREQKDRIITLLDKNRRLHSNYNVKHTHVFGGILHCGYCGSMMYSFPVGKRDGWEHSTYHCGTRRKSANKCSQPAISDTKVGEFIFNLIINMLNAQTSFTTETTIDDLQASILRGDTFKNISSIDPNDLEYLHSLLLSGDLKGNFYGKTEHKPVAKSDLQKLKSRRQRSVRALERLQSLFLYSDNAMSEKDFILQREAIEKEIDEIDQQMASFTDTSDEVFIQQSSEYIIAKNLEGRNYIYYKRLAQSVDPKVLQTFISQILESVTVKGDQFHLVAFRNGIQLHFSYKKEP